MDNSTVCIEGITLAKQSLLLTTNNNNNNNNNVY